MVRPGKGVGGGVAYPIGGVGLAAKRGKHSDSTATALCPTCGMVCCPTSVDNYGFYLIQSSLCQIVGVFK